MKKTYMLDTNISSLIKKVLSEQGTPIRSIDVMIVGHAISENCTLVTNNLREFTQVPELTIVGWV